MARESIQNVNYGFYGARLNAIQRVQRLYNVKDNTWGFKDADLLVRAYATMMGESGGYLKAFHHNVDRNEDETIKRYYWNGLSFVTNQTESVDGKEFMKVKSTDLGFIQKNTIHNPAAFVEMTEEASKHFVDQLFVENPKLANGYESCKIAWQMYNTVVNGKKREFTPWVAYTNGSWLRNKPHAVASVAKFLAHRFLDDPDFIQTRP